MATLTETDDITTAFRQIMRGVASTVTALSTADAGQRYGMIATAVMSVSMDPPSLVVAINQSASIHEPLSRGKLLCVNVLSKNQDAISRHFSKSGGDDRFKKGLWRAYSGDRDAFRGVPYLPDAQTAMFCKITKEVSFGTHSLFIATVEEVVSNFEATPLVYCDGAYGSFRESPNRDSSRLVGSLTNDCIHII